MEALRSLGVSADARLGSGDDLELVVMDGRHRVGVDVKSLARVTVNDALRMARTPAAGGAVPMVVADRIVPQARRVLSDAGWAWLDRRGHIRLRSESLVIDADIPSLLNDTPRSPRSPLDTDVGIDVATSLLAHPDAAMSVRDVVAFSGRSLGAVHQALRGLRAEHLTGSDGRALYPEMFWEVAERWRPVRVDLLGCPQPGARARTDQVDLGLDDIARTEGWAVRDVLAANAYGAFNVVRGDHPVDFYVPDERAVRVARRLYGDAVSVETRAASVAVAPVAWACRHRVDLSQTARAGAAAHFGFVHPLIAALDLAIDASRGREVLAEWMPPEPYVRVW